MLVVAIIVRGRRADSRDVRVARLTTDNRNPLRPRTTRSRSTMREGMRKSLILKEIFMRTDLGRVIHQKLTASGSSASLFK